MVDKRQRRDYRHELHQHRDYRKYLNSCHNAT
jgi:hypothetical protein